MLPTNTSWGHCVYCLSVNMCQLVYCLSINEVTASVSWSFVCQIKIDMVVRTMTLSSLSNFITTNLGRMLHATCQTGLHVILSTSHLRTLYIENHGPSDGQVVYIHVHYGVHGEMYISIDSHLIDLSLCCIIGSQIKKIRVLVVKQELLISCHPNELQSFVSPRGPLRQHPLA